MMTSRVVFLLLCVVVLQCFLSAEASLKKQRVQKMRGSMKLAARSHAKANEDTDNDDDADDDDDDDDEDTSKDDAKSQLRKDLAQNVAKQEALKAKLGHLSDEVASGREIDSVAKEVMNETQSPAMANMLGAMWKEMRMFETPLYAEHVNKELKATKREEKQLEEKLSAGAAPKTSAKLSTEKEAVANYGGNDCRCIGIDELEGTSLATLKDGSKVDYPADLGARCEAWDLNKHPSCPDADWCKQKWCYVDPCKCDIKTLPKPSVYLPGAKYQGKPVHFSYATCGGADSYSAEKDKKTAKAIEKTCAVEVKEAKWGAEECRCVGVAPQPGTTKVNIKGKQVDFPADTGATCQAWEEDNHPDCQGDSPPDWCAQSWCYVDPCSCKLPVSPKTSSYLPESNFQGRPIYYSYATCGGKDSWTAGKHKTACVNQKSSGDCGKLDKCAWTGKECLGKELVDVCQLAPESKSAASGLTAIAAFLLPLISLVK